MASIDDIRTAYLDAYKRRMDADPMTKTIELDMIGETLPRAAERMSISDEKISAAEANLKKAQTELKAAQAAKTDTTAAERSVRIWTNKLRVYESLGAIVPAATEAIQRSYER